MTDKTLDALKHALDALQLCLAQLYHDGVPIEPRHPKRIAATTAENCTVKITDILTTTNADSSQAKTSTTTRSADRAAAVMPDGSTASNVYEAFECGKRAANAAEAKPEPIRWLMPDGSCTRDQKYGTEYGGIALCALPAQPNAAQAEDAVKGGENG
jgi:hypothetical protein